ncbi:bifunctional DNA-formamidopyrimidine glycosylase/DNA-(apurinic or apyrimidinic site) lyase [Thermodesulfobacteriota bacterium]
MPELPEVQTIVNDLTKARLINVPITGAHVFWQRSIATGSPRSFPGQVIGRNFGSIWRRGKYIGFDFNGGGHLLLHLRMSGRLHLVSAGMRRAKHEHVVLSFQDDRELRLYDPRKFGRLYLVKDADLILGRLGPEPLGRTFTAVYLKKILSSRKRLIKPLLLDQNVIAGLGNIYVDEALWDAGIHPCRIASSLSSDQVHGLYRAIRKVLKQGIANAGTSLGTGKGNFHSITRQMGSNQNHLHVYRQTGLPCPRCKTPIERLVVGQRGTHICINCQSL